VLRDFEVSTNTSCEESTNSLGTGLIFSQLLILKGSGHILIFFSTSHRILCLQAEPDNETGENGASDTSDVSHCVANGDILAERQVTNFISDDFATPDICRCF